MLFIVIIVLNKELLVIEFEIKSFFVVMLVNLNNKLIIVFVNSI